MMSDQYYTLFLIITFMLITVILFRPYGFQNICSPVESFQNANLSVKSNDSDSLNRYDNRNTMHRNGQMMMANEHSCMLNNMTQTEYAQMLEDRKKYFTPYEGEDILVYADKKRREILGFE